MIACNKAVLDEFLPLVSEGHLTPRQTEQRPSGSPFRSNMTLESFSGVSTLSSVRLAIVFSLFSPYLLILEKLFVVHS
ncbi:MAG: hypothetical protein VST70_07960 [Nitrospirota bacterium]|nr:hypothetical protein [Nitrospirota bacterium]